uniref:Ion_trans_2 domain-containing protein n=1 Tax=Parastrongyloides trichosuri TaxID=131310 RepID=A0A0N4ZLR9_PARTI
MEEVISKPIYKIRLYIYFLSVSAALLFGTFLFYIIEKEEATEIYNNYINRCTLTKQEIIEKINFEFLNKNDSFEENIKNLFNQLDECHRNDDRKRISEFDISKSAVFTFSILARIGYGTVYPHNLSGHLFFLIFGLITIPIFIAFYVELYENVLRNQKNNSKASRLIVAAIVLIIVGISSVLNHIFELHLVDQNITIGDHFLFFYDSISKIGLGSYEPENSIRFLLVEVPLLFIGIAFFSLYVNTIEQFIRHDLPIIIKRKVKEDKIINEKWLKFIIKDVDKRDIYLLTDYRDPKHDF